MKYQKYLKFVFYLIIGVIVFYKAFSFIDPDFGWHLATGNLILKSGFPKTDPYSYTMPSFPIIEYEWLVDVTFAKLYPIVGLPGISILFSALFLSAVLISVSGSKKLKIPLFVIGISSLIPFFSVSPKIFSWLLFPVFIIAVYSKTFWKKYWLLIPLTIVLWTNLHGSFPEALVILSVVFICKSFRERRIWLKGLMVTFLSLLATLINPYGPRIWLVVWQTISDPLIKYRIAEWQPTYLNLFAFSFLALFLFTISGIFISKCWRRFKTEEIILNLIFFIQAIFAVRMIPYWVLIDLPMVAVAINYFLIGIKGGKGQKERLRTVFNGMFLFVGAFFILQGLDLVYLGSKTLKEETFYPKGAVTYLERNLPNGQIFSEYNWGGYLIWKFPEKKVFISGMMPVWRWQANLPGETNDAMTDYLDIVQGKNSYREFFNKYKIGTVLLYMPEKQDPVINFAEKITSFLGIAGSTSAKNPLYDELEKDGWRRVFKDNTSVILESPRPLNL